MFFDIYLIIQLLGVLLGLWFVFRKAGVAHWKALIPIYNIIVWVKVCGKGWKWYIYFLIPAINIFVFLLLVAETAKVFHRYGFWEQLLAVMFPWVYLPLIGLNKMEYHDPTKEPPHKVSEARDWADAIAFALVAAVLIRGHVIEFYNIPSSSMEKSLMTGDYLLVSKMAYGSRVAMTPWAFPLVHNVLPFSGGQSESYLSWPRLPYHRYPGLGHVERFDAVVFNYPDGDTVCTAWQSNCSYHELVREMGREAVLGAKQLPVGGQMVENHIRVRPVDKRENFIKRCIGLPGEELLIKDQQVYINGKQIAQPIECQHTYAIHFNGSINTKKVLSDLGVSNEDYANALTYNMYTGVFEVPLTQQMAATLRARPDVASVDPVMDPVPPTELTLFPHIAGLGWTVDNFGPVHIPAKGERIDLTLENLPFYQRVIEVYEGNTLEVRDGKILINGEVCDHYIPQMDYYWMMGDNRHNSVDSRYWGFVPEDHIAGKATLVVLSKDVDNGGFRWKRTFRKASRL